MKVLQRLSELDAQQLTQLERNATALLTGAKALEAQEVLNAVSEERARRTHLAVIEKATERAAIQERMVPLGLQARALAAFQEMPPVDWERAALRALRENPGATTETLSEAIGYSGTYMNWFGHVCRDREPWLGAVIAGVDGRVVYSSLLVDFGETTDDAGHKMTTWRLKPEVEVVLNSLHI